MTTYQSTQAFIDDVYKFIRSNQYEAALELIQANRDVPMDQLNRLDFIMWTYNRMCIVARLGHIDEAIAQFQEAIDRGFWYSPQQLSDDEDLKLLVGDPRYEELCKISTARYGKFASETKPFVDVYPPTNGTGKPSLLMALHGNSSSGALSYDAWKIAPEYGRLLALPTSTQFFIEGGYLWNDFNQTESEIKQHYATLTSQHDLDVGQTIIGGFSMGASFAVWATLNQLFPIKGFIAVGLFVRDLDDWVSRLDTLKDTGVRGYILVGEEDSGLLENTLAFAKEMQQQGIPCELDVRPGLGHEFPDDFDETLKHAIDFVSQP